MALPRYADRSQWYYLHCASGGINWRPHCSGTYINDDLFLSFTSKFKKKLCFQTIFYLPPYFGSHSTNDFCKGCFTCSSWNTSQCQLCFGTLLPPRRDLNSPVELLKIAPAPLQSIKSRFIIYRVRRYGLNSQCSWKSQTERNTKIDTSRTQYSHRRGC